MRQIKIKNKFNLILIFFSFAFSEIKFGEWEHITSYITPNDILINDNNVIFATTMGGLLSINIDNESFTKYGKDFLEYLDLNQIIKDEYNNFIVGSNSPDGSIQVFNNLNSLTTYLNDFNNIDKILFFEYNTSHLFAIYQTNMNYGILIFEYENEIPIYKDYYDNFPINISQITDLDIFGNNIIITSPEGILKGNYKDDNLKFSNNWNLIDSPALSFNYYQDLETIIIGGYNNLWMYDTENWVDLDLDYDQSLSDNFQVIDIISNEYGILVLTKKQFFLLGDDNIDFTIPVNSEFTCIDSRNNYIALGLKNNGIILYDLINNDYTNFIPNTPIHNQYDALTLLDDGSLVGVVNRIEQRLYSPTDNIAGITMFQNGVYRNFISSKTMTYYEYPINNDDFSSYEVDYIAGEKNSWSIKQNSLNTVIFSNSGINSDIENDKGGLVELDFSTASVELYDTTNSIIDGLNGIYSSTYTYGYLTINQMYMDSDNNVWIVNPYSEKNHTLAAIDIYDSDEWLHIMSPNDKSYLPQDLTIDLFGLAWFGFQYASNLDATEVYSEGGIKVLDTKNTLSNTYDDVWLEVVNPELLPNGKNTSIWSITSDSYNRIWVLSSQGIQGYIYNRNGNNIYLIPLYQQNDGDLINYLSFLSIEKGDRILNDGKDNIWLATQNSGVFVILNNLTPLDEHIEFSVEKSKILSNKIFDIVFNKNNGKVYIATEKGISITRLPIDTVKKNEKNNIRISPNPFYVPGYQAQIYNLYPGSTVKILKLNGDLVVELNSDFFGNEDTMVLWDGKNKQGNFVGSGIYLVSAYHINGGSSVSKIAVINK